MTTILFAVACRPDDHRRDAPSTEDSSVAVAVASPIRPWPLGIAMEPWPSGLVGGWARATMLGLYQGDHLGEDMAGFDPDGDGRDSLSIGAPHLDLPPTSGYYRRPAPKPDDLDPNPNPTGPRVYVLSDPNGAFALREEDVILSEKHWGDDAIGQSVEALSPTGPLLVGDYFTPTRDMVGDVFVVDETDQPPVLTRLSGDYGEECGSDVGAGDVDGDGAPELLMACLGQELVNPGLLRIWSSAGSQWSRIGSISGTKSDAWFGRPVVGGFDLDRDGYPDLAIGEQNVGTDLASAVYVVSGPIAGDHTLTEVGAHTLWTPFTPARLAVGDIDGDGAAELLVTDPGQPGWSLHPNPEPGHVVVIRDPVLEDGPTIGAGWVTLTGTEPAEGFGTSVALGDFDADGWSDVVVGAPGSPIDPSFRPGRVYLFRGPFAGGTLTTADADAVLLGSEDEQDYFGYAMTVGDFDGDGVEDLAVSAIWDSRAAREAGAVYILASVPRAGSLAGRTTRR